MRLTLAWELLPLVARKNSRSALISMPVKTRLRPRMRRAKIILFTAAPLQERLHNLFEVFSGELEHGQLPKIKLLLPFLRNLEVESAALSDEQVQEGLTVVALVGAFDIFCFAA